MATSTPFAYNTGSPIDGTTQVGNLAVGIPTSGFTNNPQFWNGPDEELGFVITVPVSGNTQPTPVPGVDASVGFYGTNNFYDESFIGISEYVSNEYNNPQTFTNAPEASTWLTNNGFWNSYGGWFLVNTYNDAGNIGEITFPNHNGGTGDLNPNDVGQAYGTTATQLYINTTNYSNIDYNTYFNNLVGNYGNLTLKQGNNSVTYSFTNDAFNNTGPGGQISSDYLYNGAPQNSLCVTSFASGDFNTNTPINVSYSAYPSSFTFTIQPSMLNSLNSIGAPQYGSPNGTSGFTITSQLNSLYDGVYGQLNDTTSINSAFNAAGAPESYNGCIALVQWGSGSDYQSGLAKIAFVYGSNLFYVTSVDGSNSDFTQTSNNNGSNLVGTFNFPATFTIISPLIGKSDWC
jgi:hypothetical protein